MEWYDLINIIAAIALASGGILVWRNLRRGGRSKAEELYHHLSALGLEAHLEEDGRVGHSGGQKPVGIITLKGANIDWIEVLGMPGQFQPHYSIDYMVETPPWNSKEATKTIRMKKVKGFPLGHIEWKGDNPLVQLLSSDSSLESRLLAEDFKGTIWILPSPKQGARISTPYLLPGAQLLQAIDTIAGYLKRSAL